MRPVCVYSIKRIVYTTMNFNNKCTHIGQLTATTATAATSSSSHIIYTPHRERVRSTLCMCIFSNYTVYTTYAYKHVYIHIYVASAIVNMYICIYIRLECRYDYTLLYLICCFCFVFLCARACFFLVDTQFPESKCKICVWCLFFFLLLHVLYACRCWATSTTQLPRARTGPPACTHIFVDVCLAVCCVALSCVVV